MKTIINGSRLWLQYIEMSVNGVGMIFGIVGTVIE